MRRAILGAALLLSGCFGFPDPNDPHDALARCEVEARAAYQTGDSVEEAMRKFEACKRREGL